ncbi:MAG: hypothetical protein CFE23_12220 [Flavobacterium sp. BFFFF1]|uniref:exo-beta-N-acetylmuramidase NamZ family protein n=1 Tax=Flavobacterium sp. BFFFF1 TaxID=2015557 RepID=UPI000BD764A0|nr:DUF1343 domain-containing protein [Flavobacterium sp. BFFFF1]OYU79775.1 MAG: hypothetical protein CFE23_12220 [Flavobacterium sp. BFFFF1]
MIHNLNVTKKCFPLTVRKHSKYFILLVFCVFILSCKPAQAVTHPVIIGNPVIAKNSDAGKVTVILNPNAVKFATGSDNFESFSYLLENKRVGIVTNQSGLLADQSHIVDFLVQKNVNLVKIFAPEHGFRGTADAGENIADGKDIATGLPIISIYGDNKKPTPQQLEGVDMILFDLQDVGARFFTYISTLHYVMEACAENSIPIVILDRPNPNGSIVDGPVLEPEYTSFVGMHQIPVLHGMTIGEYAQMINGEKWLKNGVQCDIKVVACSAYTRDMPYSISVKPSPNLPNDMAINLYASLCFFEGTNVSVGRGTDKQFQIFGSPYLPNVDYCFVPKPNVGAKDPQYTGQPCFGEDLSGIPKIERLELKWLIQAYNETEDKSKFFNSYFTKLAGTKKLREQIEAGMTASQIRASWETGLIEFKEKRRKYLIYAE